MSGNLTLMGRGGFENPVPAGIPIELHTAKQSFSMGHAAGGRKYPPSQVTSMALSPSGSNLAFSFLLSLHWNFALPAYGTTPQAVVGSMKSGAPTRPSLEVGQVTGWMQSSAGGQADPVECSRKLPL